MLSRPSIGMVAAQARVSTKTVSRVINNSQCVRPAMREHVMQVIRQLSYSPSPTARSLRGHRSYLIGLPFDSPYASYVTEVQSGSLSTCSAGNYRLVMHACDSRAADLEQEIRQFVQHVRVDGVILSPPLSDSDEVIQALRAEEIPFVRIAPARHIDLSCSVFSNDRDACARMTEYLASLGHERIAFVTADRAGDQRYTGYCAGLRLVGLQLDPQLVARSAGTLESALECAHVLLRLSRDKRPTAIFAGTDVMAVGVLKAAHELRIAVPDELSVVGYDDAPIASQVWPRLTTIHQPLRAMAQIAASLLMAKLRSEPDERSEHLLESTPIFRQSTAAFLRGRQAP